MGWVSTRTTSRGVVRHTACYRDIKGALRSAGTYSTEKQAIKAYTKEEAAMEAGQVGEARRGRQQFARYVFNEWFPHAVLEARTRENYTYWLDRYVVPEFGGMQMRAIMPIHVREWITRLKDSGVKPPTIRQCKTVLDAILTTAFEVDKIIPFHAGRGIKTPPIAKKQTRIITVDQFDRIYQVLENDTMRLLVETDIETGLRWGELTELRVRDIDLTNGIITVSRAVVELTAEFHPEGGHFLVKEYPKDREWRKIKIPAHLVTKIEHAIAAKRLGQDDLLFEHQQSSTSRRRVRPEQLPDPETLGWTEPNTKGRRYRHGTTTAYVAAPCRCQNCRDTMAAYRAERRAAGKDTPRKPRQVSTDGHIGRHWFYRNVWNKALTAAELGFRVTPHGLRHAHASWLLAGGADLQVVKERLGHGSITTTEKYLHTLPNAGDTALQAMQAIRGSGVGTQPAVPVSAGYAAGDRASKTPDMAEMLRMMAAIKETYEVMAVKASSASTPIP